MQITDWEEFTEVTPRGANKTELAVVKRKDGWHLTTVAVHKLGLTKEAPGYSLWFSPSGYVRITKGSGHNATIDSGTPRKLVDLELLFIRKEIKFPVGTKLIAIPYGNDLVFKVCHLMLSPSESIRQQANNERIRLNNGLGVSEGAVR